MRPAGRKRRRRPKIKRHQFTKEECQRGYQAALAKCSQSWDLLAWFCYRVRGFYRHKTGPQREDLNFERI